jgi:hypothetical protein
MKAGFSQEEAEEFPKARLNEESALAVSDIAHPGVEKIMTSSNGVGAAIASFTTPFVEE